MKLLPNARMPGALAFASCAEPYSALWRTLLGLVAIVMVYLQISMVGLAAWIGISAMLFGQAADLSLTGQLARPVIAGLLASLGVLIPAVWVVVRMIHNRTLLSVIGPDGFRAGQYLIGAGVVLVLAGVLSGISALTTPISANAAPIALLWWFVPMTVLLMFQTAAEELVFRGYLQQQLSARFRSAWMWWVLPSVLFGAMHFDPGSFGSNAWLPAAAAAMMGLILGDVTARTGNLSAAMGMHLANNMIALFFLSLPSALSSFALFTLDLDLNDTNAVRVSLLSSVLVLVVLYGAYLGVLAWRARRG
ncbi:MAG: type II CAAX endopeptidase family protein [Pseudomonadota bacterium]